MASIVAIWTIFATVGSNAQPCRAKEQKPRSPFQKPMRSQLVGRHEGAAIIKFTDGTGIRLRGAAFVVLDSELEIERAQRHGVTRPKLDVQLDIVNFMLERDSVSIGRMLTSAEQILRDQRCEAEEISQRELPDLNLFFEVRFSDKSPSHLEKLRLLNQLDIVEYAAPKPVVAPSPADISPLTPSFTANQTYFVAAPNGIDVAFARQLPGGRGESIRIVDVETGWVVGHEDWPTLVSTSGDNYDLPEYRHHGLATVGEIAAIENGYGMTGIAPLVEVSVASPIVGGGYALPDGVERAYEQSRVGDIILIEQQIYYDYPDDQGLCPPEWDPGVFAVVQTAVANGRIVMLTAGNGAENLDSVSRFGTRFDRSVEDSGAIYVGAGDSSTHVPLGFSNYGQRLDVQGWGENIATLGYGDLFHPNADDRQAYTNTFGGTSGAAPIVTGAAAIVQGIRRARGLADLTSQQMRSALLVGATAQGAGVHVGPLPNLRSVIEATPVPAPAISASATASGDATVAWSPVAGVVGYELFRKNDHGALWALVSTLSTTTFVDSGLMSGRTYLYRVRAYDAAGNRSAFSDAELATTIDYTDPVLATTPIRAVHIVEIRTAVNAICTYAGTSLCPSAPFSGAALDVAQVAGDPVIASDFTDAQNQISALRSAIGASPATFHETPAAGITIRRTHMETLRLAAN